MDAIETSSWGKSVAMYNKERNQLPLASMTRSFTKTMFTSTFLTSISLEFLSKQAYSCEINH